jgi:hypothetical protein
MANGYVRGYVFTPAVAPGWQPVRPELSDAGARRVPQRRRDHPHRGDDHAEWFSVDMAGNVERGYKPNGRGHNYNEVTIKIRG